MYSVVPLVNRNVLRAPRAANASVCYARESVTEGTGRTRLIVRLSQCNVLARTGSMVKLGAVLPRGLAEKLRNYATTLLYIKEGKEKNRECNRRGGSKLCYDCATCELAQLAFTSAASTVKPKRVTANFRDISQL